jgi:hypothetical protein
MDHTNYFGQISQLIMGGPHNAENTIYFGQTTQFIMGEPHHTVYFG